MPHKDVLFDLVKSLNKTEKRYFQVQAAKAGKKEGHSLSIFKTLSEQKIYDDDQLKKKLSASDVSNFTFNKHYLYESLLRSLQQFHRKSSAEIEAMNLLHQSDILFDHQQLLACKKALARAGKLAAKFELYAVQIMIAQRQLAVFRITRYSDTPAEKLDMFFYDYRRVTEKANRLAELQRSYFTVIHYSLQKGFSRTQKELNAYMQFLKDPILKSDTRDFGFWEWYFYLGMHIVTWSVCENYVKSYHYAQKLYAIINENKHIVREQPSIIISIMGNLVLGQMNAKKFEELDNTIKQFRNLALEYSIRQKVYIEDVFYLSRRYECQYLVTAGKAERAVKVVDELEKYGYKKTDVGLNFLIMAVSFAGERFSKAAQYATEIINTTYNTRSDLVCFARIYRLLILLETNKADIIDYSARAALKDLKKYNRLYELEMLLIDFIRNTLLLCETKKEEVVVYKKFKAEVNKFLKTEVDKRVLSYFDILAWIDSKMEGKSYSQKIRENSTKK